MAAPVAATVSATDKRSDEPVSVGAAVPGDGGIAAPSSAAGVALAPSRAAQLFALIPFEISDVINRILITNAVPDRLVRRAMRWMMWDRTRDYSTKTVEQQMEYKQAFVRQLRASPIALVPGKANEQHYEVPSEFYNICLGRHLKYSCCLYETPTSTLDEAERAMLDLYVVRADIKDGMSILDMGCGWGSFSLYAAGRFPNSRIVAISNSRTQRAYIEGEAKKRGFGNLTVVTCDANDLTPEKLGVRPVPTSASSSSSSSSEPEAKIGSKKGKAATATTTTGSAAGAGAGAGDVEGKEAKEEAPVEGAARATTAPSDATFVGGFDRIISIEMFEHMKNYERLFALVAQCVKPDTGRVFVHIFTNKFFPYHFEGDNWMARYFFSGGTMPSDDLFLYFQRDLQLQQQWRVNGKHYARTSRDWLRRMDANSKVIRKLFADTYGGEAEGKRWWVMWRVFYMAVEEMFAYNNGNEWMVSHYLFTRPSRAAVLALPSPVPLA